MEARKIGLWVVLLMIIVGTLIVGESSAVSSEKKHWADATIQSWIQKGWASSNTLIDFNELGFQPDRAITRAEFAALINYAFQYHRYYPAYDFEDVDSTDWFYREVQVANYSGYMQGTSPKQFQPLKVLERQETATVACRLMFCSWSSDDTLNYKDNDNIPKWSRFYIGGISKYKVMGGYDDGKFRPFERTTRAEAIVIIDRIIKERFSMYPVQGLITTDNGQPIVNGMMRIVNMQTPNEDIHAEIVHGRWGVYLDEGNYLIKEYYDQQIKAFTPLNQELVITENNKNSQLLIKVPDFNVQGRVDLPGGEGLQSGTISFHRVTNSHDQIDTNHAQVIRGNFSVRLEPGEYYVGDINYEEYGYIQVSTRITVEAGKTLNLDVLKDFHLVQGEVIWKGNARANGTFTIMDRSNNRMGLGVLKDGKAIAYLRDGVYKVISITQKDNNTSLIPSDHLSLFRVEGKNILDFKVIMPSYNMTATIRDEAGQLVNKGNIFVACNRADEYIGQIIDGRLEMTLPQGKCTVNLFSQTYEPYEAFQLYVPFDSTSNITELNIRIPEKNTHGTIITSLPADTGYTSISLSKTDEPHMLLYHIRLDDWEFAEYLPPGTYNVYSYQTQNKNFEINKTIEIVDGKLNEIKIEIP